MCVLVYTAVAVHQLAKHAHFLFHSLPFIIHLANVCINILYPEANCLHTQHTHGIRKFIENEVTISIEV